MQVTRTSIFTGTTRTLELNVTENQFNAWRAGALIQDAFPQLNKSEREFLQTGGTQEEWDEMCSDE